MKNVVLGQYLPLNSFFHKLDPRTKILALIGIIVCIFIPTSYIGYLILSVLLVSSILLAKLQLSYVFKTMKPMMFMMIFLSIINIFVIKTGTPLLTIGKLVIYTGAIFQTIYIVVRLALLVMATTLLTATTKPLDMTLGLEDLMKPLTKIHFPSHEIAMMISLALRFIPTLLEEADRILKAQASRGVDIENGSFKEKIAAILSLIVPLFVSCFQKADDLADAMEARGYVVGAKRVRYKQLKYMGRDYLVLFIVLALIVGFTAIAIWVV